MNKKNKFKLASIGLIAGISLFTVTGFAMSENVSSYERYKTSVIQTFLQNNYTVSIQSTATINGELVHTLESMYKTDGLNYNSITTINGRSHELNSHSYSRFDASPASVQFFELLADTLVGDTKNYVVSNDNQVSINLSKHQAPQLVQLGLAFLSETFKQHDEGYHLIDVNYVISTSGMFEFEILALEELSLDNFSFVGELTDDGDIQNGHLVFTMSGYNQYSNEHLDIEFTLYMEFSEIGTTILDMSNQSDLYTLQKTDGDVFGVS